MSDHLHSEAYGALPERFVKQVKDALEHLYDFLYLQRHPLVQVLQEDPTTLPAEMSGQRLRRELVSAIEVLNPGRDVAFRAPQGRLYNLLLLHYVEGMTVQEAARELGISRRQAHRDLRRGEESVAAVLWNRHALSFSQALSAARLSSVQEEIARLEVHPRSVDVRVHLRRAQESVEQLATQRSIRFRVEAPPGPVIVSVDPMIADQVLVNTLSHAVSQARPGTLALSLTVHHGQTSLLLRYAPGPEAIGSSVVSGVVAQLAERLGWTVSLEDDQGKGMRTVVLCMTVRYPSVLVIDDNEGLVELLRDYLIGHACRVIAATSGQEGLKVAQEATPDAIVLDVMMPGVDGWRILQRLRNHPQTVDIPVIICSVFNNPELAYSLGASLFLPKPVSRDDVLTALNELGVV
jgi:CheY-like chemotaxis protein